MPNLSSLLTGGWMANATEDRINFMVVAAFNQLARDYDYDDVVAQRYQEATGCEIGEYDQWLRLSPRMKEEAIFVCRLAYAEAMSEDAEEPFPVAAIEDDWNYAIAHASSHTPYLDRAKWFALELQIAALRGADIGDLRDYLRGLGLPATAQEIVSQQRDHAGRLSIAVTRMYVSDDWNGTEPLSGEDAGYRITLPLIQQCALSPLMTQNIEARSWTFEAEYTYGSLSVYNDFVERIGGAVAEEEMSYEKMVELYLRNTHNPSSQFTDWLCRVTVGMRTPRLGFWPLKAETLPPIADVPCTPFVIPNKAQTLSRVYHLTLCARVYDEDGEPVELDRVVFKLTGFTENVVEIDDVTTDRDDTAIDNYDHDGEIITVEIDASANPIAGTEDDVCRVYFYSDRPQRLKDGKIEIIEAVRTSDSEDIADQFATQKFKYAVSAVSSNMAPPTNGLSTSIHE